MVKCECGTVYLPAFFPEGKCPTCDKPHPFTKQDEKTRDVALSVCRELNEGTMKCLGCGGIIPWDGKSAFCYTCPCGATVFYNEENGNIHPPASLVMRAVNDKPPFHIDCYVGVSSHTSKLKEEFIGMLKRNGAVWGWECKECRGKFIERKRMEIEKGLLRVELHPELRAILEIAHQTVKCEKCGSVYPPYKFCPQCGHVPKNNAHRAVSHASGGGGGERFSNGLCQVSSAKTNN